MINNLKQMNRCPRTSLAVAFGRRDAIIGGGVVVVGGGGGSVGRQGTRPGARCHIVVVVEGTDPRRGPDGRGRAVVVVVAAGRVQRGRHDENDGLHRFRFDQG